MKNKLISIAHSFQAKLSLAQNHSQTAQPSDIDKVLNDAGVRPTANDIDPLATKAKVPDDVSFGIVLVVEKGLKASFYINSDVKPMPNSLNILKNMLNNAYAGKIMTALQNAKVNVVDPVMLKIVNY
jgi:hypothetical protein